MIVPDSFDYFVTLSFDGSKINRFDPEAVYAKTKSFLDNAHRRHGFSYLLVPGYHEVRDPKKLAQKRQFESAFHPGLSIISEVFPHEKNEA